MRRIATALVLAALLAPGRALADDKAECIASFDSGQALRASGKLTQALAQFSVCSRPVCPRSLQKACVDQASASSALLPTIVLSATNADHGDVVDAHVSVDGVPLATALDGKAVSIDPGLHTFRFERSGFAPVERQVVIKEGQQGQQVAVQLGPTGPVEPTPVAPAGASTSNLRWAGVAVGGVGLVAIGVGSVFGATALSKWSDAKSECGAGCATTSPAYATKSTGETDATVSTVALVVGGVLAAGGVALFVAAPKAKSSTSAALVPTLGGLGLVGRF